ncbi:MAG: helix-turn-helix transcriptional regulator [Dialister sp.]|nr:helix-turn-helix transcriptional regulator [Dialister sp.]
MNIGKLDIILENSFRQKLRILRTLYGLTLNEVKDLLELKSGGNVSGLENGRVRPSYATLVKIQALYGISIDWIMGFSDTPYNSITIEIALVQSIKKVQQLIKDGKIYPDFITNLKDYYDSYDRLKLENRFNLILLQNYIIYDQQVRLFST